MQCITDDEYIPDAKCEASFHGELWFRCPHCNESFEYYDGVFGRNGIKMIDIHTYICGKCGKKYRIK